VPSATAFETAHLQARCAERGQGRSSTSSRPVVRMTGGTAPGAQVVFPFLFEVGNEKTATVLVWRSRCSFVLSVLTRV
jgi:hypothetical protein